MDAVSRSLSPMRYYLRGLDVTDDQEDLPAMARRNLPRLHRSASVQSDSAVPRRGSKLRSSSDVDSIGLFGSGDEAVHDDDSELGLETVEGSSAEESAGEEEEDEEEEEDADMIDDGEADDAPGLPGKKKDKLEFELIGHR